MRSKIFTSAQIATLALGVGSFLACSPASSGGGGSAGNDGKGGTGKGGSSAKGGSGGSTAKGGSGGGTAGTGGGTAGTGGGTAGTGGGTAGTGGGTAGAGGAAAKGGSGGGVAGAGGGTAGAGGAAGSAGAAPQIGGPGVFFSGKDMNITKMVAGDAEPGYVHFTGDTSVQGARTAPPVVSVSDPLLDALGIKYAIDANVVAVGMTVFSFNYRMDDPAGTGFAWKYFDASAFAGISFWAKADTARIFFSYTTYDANSLGTDETSTGTCNMVGRGSCGTPSGYVKSAIANTTWSRVVLPFATFNPAIDSVSAGRSGRVDMWTAGNFHLQITGITFVTAAQL